MSIITEVAYQARGAAGEHEERTLCPFSARELQAQTILDHDLGQVRGSTVTLNSGMPMDRLGCSSEM